MAWTDDRVELLKKLWNDGLSASQIANQMGGVTRNAVIGKVHRLGLSGRVTSTRGRAAKGAGKTATSKQRSQRREPKMPPINMGSTAVKFAEEVKLAPVKQEKISPLALVKPSSGDNITIFELTEYTCRWPEGDPSTNDFHFCGGKSTSTGPYCEAHAAIAYQPTVRRAKVKKAS
ncbi:MAG: GcrA cell cycle regulator [Rhizobiales bacterium]|nr:GcrA cell cycle regulator [Hyphomicrobiales bacterium]NRB14278.1 GcrA cell cycle regulator [Hyphomicrobiales bacterium]